jgi:hypothetical protein
MRTDTPIGKMSMAPRARNRLAGSRKILRRRLDLIAATEIPVDAEIIDIGGGAYVLSDGLIVRGFRHLTVLDLSGAALGVAKEPHRRYRSMGGRPT